MKNPRKIIISVPGRVCFCGENIDWITGPSVLCTLDDLRTFIEIKAIEKPYITIRSTNFKKEKKVARITRNYKNNWHDYILGSLNVLRQKFKIRPSKISINIESVFPIGAGLSSSAALCVGLWQAFNNFYNLGLDINKIASLAYITEHYELKIPCGQMDQYAVAHGGITYLDCSSEPPKIIEKLKVNKKFAIVVGDTKEKRKTGEIIKTLKKRLKEKEPLFLKYIKETCHLIEILKNHLRDSEEINIEKIGNIISRAHFFLKNYQLTSNEKLDLLVEKSIEAGALGAKLTGAGRGGCMFAICKIKDKEKIADAVRSANGVPFISTQIANEGVKIESCFEN